MRHRTLLYGVTILLLVACRTVAPSPAPTPTLAPSPAPTASPTPLPGPSPTATVDRVAAWREDLDVLVEHVTTTHSFDFRFVDETGWRAAADDLRERIPELSDNAIIMEMQRLVAMLQDGHSTIHLLSEESWFRFYPLKLYLFSDGLYVIRAREPFADALGMRVVRIGDYSAEEAYQRMSQYVPRDNDSTLKSVTPMYLVLPEALDGTGIIADMDQPEFVLERPDGSQYTINPEAISQTEYDEWLLATTLDEEDYDAVRFPQLLFTGLMQEPEPLYLSQRYTEDFWYTILDDSRTLYIQYNDTFTPQNAPVDEIRALLDSNPVGWIVLDLRHNPGGDIGTATPVLRLMHEPAVNQPGRLFVLIGRQTFSAATLVAIDLDRETMAIFVGEPTGGGIVMGGGARPRAMPHSGLRVFISREYHDNFDPANPRDAVLPDIPVELSSADYFAHRDPVLDAALQIGGE